MKRQLTLTLALAAALALSACSKPGIDAPAPPTSPVAAPDAPVAGEPAPTTISGAPAAPIADPVIAPPTGDRFDPAVTATDTGWLVGWTEVGAGDDAGKSRVVAGFLPFGSPPATPLAPTAVLATGDVAGLRLAGPQAVWLAVDGAERRIVARRLGSDGTLDPERDAVVLATSATLGSPEAIATPDGCVVAWTDGLHAHAARLGADGAVAARATWWGGNERPSRFDPDPHDGPPQRSTAMPSRPWINAMPTGAPQDSRGAPVAGTPVVVTWEAEWWYSDDQAGNMTVAHQVTWGEETGAGQEVDRPGGVWTWLSDRDARSGLSLVQEHDPNGGPWVLRLVGVGAEPIQLTSGPAGPYAVDLTSVPAPAAAFHDAAVSAYRVMRIGAAGERTEVTLPTTAPFGEAEVALAGAAGRQDLAVAHTTVAEGRLDVRLAVLAADASGGHPGPRLTRPEAHAVPLKSRFSASQMDAAYVGGQTLLTWQDHWDWRIRAVWLQDGAPTGPITELSAGSPRSEGGAAAALPDGGALVVFHSCSGSSICGATKLHAVRLAPGKKPTPVNLGARPGDRHPRICVGPDGPVLAVQRGDYGSVSVIWGPPDARHTVDVPTPNHNNGGFAQGLTCGPGGIFVAMSSFGSGNDTTRVDLVAITAAGATTRETLQVPGSLWSYHGLVDAGDRVGLLANLATPTGAQVGLRWYPTAGGPPTVDVLWRGHSMWNPEVASAGSGADRRFAAAWYDRGSDGVYAVLTAPDGRRLAGPLRLDDPASRESQNAPVIVHEGDTWRAYWEEQDQLWRARPF